MSPHTILQAVQASLPPNEWSVVFEALRQDARLWQSLQDPERCARALSVTRTNIRDWSPASLAIACLPDSPSLDALLAQPLQPLEPGLRLHAMRAYEAQSPALPAPESLEPPDENLAETTLEPSTLEQACFVALALREKLRTQGSWQEVAAELHERVQENPGLWYTASAILFGLAPEPVGLLQALIHPDQAPEDWELGIHTLLSNPDYPAEQAARIQAVIHEAGFTPARSLSLLRALSAASPTLAQQTAAWMLAQDAFTRLPDSENVLEACQQTILLAEIQAAAGEETASLETIEKARDISLRLQAELESAWAYMANNLQKDETPSAEVTQKLTEALRKSAAALPRQPESADILAETESFLSEVLLQAGDSDETHKWLETLTQEGTETEGETPLSEQPPALLLQAARLAQQAGEFARFNDLLHSALQALEQPPTTAQAHSLKQRLEPATRRYARDLTDLTQLAGESGQTDIAHQAARLALAHARPEPADLVTLGEALYDEKNPQEATSVFEMAVGLLPSYLEGRRWLAASLEAQNAWEAALPHRSYTVSHLQDTHQLNSTDLHALGLCAHQAGQYPAAVKADLLAIELDPGDLTAHLLLAGTYGKTGEYAASIEHYGFVTQAAPTNPDAWLGLSEIQDHIGQTRNAIETLRAAEQALPDNVEIHLLLGQILLRDQALTPALASLEKAYELSHLNGCGMPHSAHDRAALVYGQALAQLGKNGLAREVLSDVYTNPEIAPSLLPEVARHYAQVLLALGATSQAIEPLETALSLQPDQPDLHLVYARALLSLHQKPTRALYSVQKALQADPSSLEAQGWMAVALDQTGQVQAAFQAYQQSLDTALAGDPAWRARLSYGIGRTGLTLGKPELALAAVQEAVQLVPECVEYQQQLAEIYWAVNLHPNALQTARTVLQLDRENPDTLGWFADQIIRGLQQAGHQTDKPLAGSPGQPSPAEGINVICHALELQPGRADLYTRLARLQILASQPEQAVENLQQILNFDSLPMPLYQEAANLAEDAGSPRLAADLYRRAAQAIREADASSYGEILLKLAESQANAQNYHAALQTLRQAASNNPADPRPYLQQADIFQELEQPESVINCLENAIPNMQQPTDQVQVHRHLALALHRQGKFPAAYHYATQAAELGLLPGALAPTLALETFVLAAELARALMLTEAAQDWLAKASAAEPPSPAASAWMTRMYCLSVELDLETSESRLVTDHLEAGLRASPRQPRLLAAQARWHLRQGDLGKALAGFASLSQVSGVSQPGAPLQAEDWYAVSRAAAEFVQWDQALSSAQQALNAQPANPVLAFNLAQLHVQAAEFQHLSAALEVVTHAPAADLLTPTAQNHRQELLHTADSLLRAARSELQEKGIEIGANNALLRWKMRARQLDLPLEDGEESQPIQAVDDIAPWVESVSDAASWLAALRRDSLVSENELQNMLQQCQGRYPDQLPVWMQAALFHAPTDPGQAFELLEKFASRSAPYPFQILRLAFQARLLFQTAHPDLAAERIDQALQLWSDEPRWHSLAAAIHQRFATSLEVADIFHHLEEAVRLEPKHLPHYLALGELLMKQPQNDPALLGKATRLLERAARLHSSQPEIWLLLAQLQSRSDQPASLEQAARSAEQSIQAAAAQPNNHKDIRALLLRADIALRQGQPKQALPFIEHAQVYDPGSSQAMLAMVQVHQAMGQPTEALKILERLLPTLTDSLPLALRRVTLLVEAGDQPAALKALDQLVADYPHHAEVLALKAEILAQTGAVERAVQSARSALQMSSSSKPEVVPLALPAQARMHHLIGLLSERAGQLDSAIHHLDQAIALAPAGIDSYLELGQVYQKQRQYQKAQQVLQLAMAAAPKDYRTYYHAGLALKDSKDYLAAESMLRRAVELAPENVLIRRQLAAVVALNLVHNPRSIAMK